MFKKIILVFFILSIMISSDIVNATTTPATIQTTTIQKNTEFGCQTKVQFIPDTNRVWYFYYYSSHIYFKTYDFNSWSSATQVSDPTSSLSYTYGEHMSINYDETGNRIQIAFTGNSKKAYYRQGTPYSNGTISWESWRTAYDAGYSVDLITVNVDTNGYPMITLSNWGMDTIERVRATATDGSSWTSTSMFSSIHSLPFQTLQLSSGYMMILGVDGSGNLLSRIYTGGTSYTYKTVATGLSNGATGGRESSFCGATNGTHVFAFYILQTDLAIYYKVLTGTWSSNPSWSSATKIEDTAYEDSSTGLTASNIESSNNDFLVVWGCGTSIYKKEYISGSWGTSTEIASGETTLFDPSLTCDQKSLNGVTTILWIQGSSSPYNIRFMILTRTVNITITSNPEGEDYIEIDDVNYTTPHTFEWNVGETHSLKANSPVSVVNGESRYIYSSWDDGGSQTHNYLVTIEDTVTATYTHQYYLDVIGGNNATGEGWKNSGVNVTSTSNWIWGTITSQKRYAITNYKIDSTNQNPVRNNTGIITTSIINMNTYHSVEYINTTQYYTTLTSTIIEFTVSQSGSQTSDNWYDYNTNCTLSATSPQTYAEVTLEFKKWYWKIGNVLQTNSTSNPFNITMVNYVDVKSYWKNPSGGGTVNNYIVSPTQAIEATITSLVTIIRGGATYNYTSLYLFLFTTGLFIFIVLFMATRKV